jgi:hypothetical protein
VAGLGEVARASPNEPGEEERGRLGPSLFAVAAFASAFLIFLVQPLVGKRILPWFGGAPAVWMLCLAFYQTALFAGYAYAHLLIRYAPPRLQLPVHAIAIAGALLALPVLPPEDSKPVGAVEPSAAILALLAGHVALPFLALAATGPLVQAWFARRYPSRSPYPLYAVSNLGSFLALLAYPFALEPRLAVSTTGRLWSLGFLATAVAVIACGGVARRGAPGRRSAAAVGPAPDRPGAARLALWLLLPACGVVLMMGVTNALCLDVAGVPFLWILPLGVYLATFVLCFGSERSHRRLPYLVLAAVALALVWFSGLEDLGALALVKSIQLQIVIYVLLLFGACMLLHGELHRLRPSASSLTSFYLCLSAGGALGGIFVGTVAPRIFDDYHELALGIALSCLLLLAARTQDSRGWLRAGAPRRRWALALALAAILSALAATRQLRWEEDVVHKERGFFGVLSVLEIEKGGGLQRQLSNGTTLHGIQISQAPRRPTSYFGVQTGIGLAFDLREPGTPVSIGVVGLGTGTLAAYGRPGDRMRFYEIDPGVIRLAGDGGYFSYLRDSPAEVEVVEGDARISLESERARGELPRFDFLVIDAFSSDAIPIHLMTREALALYLDALAVDGLLAFHVSNRHFDLAPVLARLAADAGLEILSIYTTWIPRHWSAEALWVFLARDEERLRSLGRHALARRQKLGVSREAMQLGRPTPGALEQTPLWTDDYSDLLGALRPLSAALSRLRRG